jgi:hypothetical protein
MNEPLDLASGRFLNEAAIHSYALYCSETYKAGKFTRVGQDFMDEVKADVESLIRGLRQQWKDSTPFEDNQQACVTFTTGALLEKIQPELNAAIGRLIKNKVWKHPSCGKTLGRTR